MKSSQMKQGFTLIELLIVVAIIAILAAIAVPNFLEAQTRAKIARAKADMRTLATGLETYRIDHGNVPLMNVPNFALSPEGLEEQTLERLTTPIAYLNGGGFQDPFPAKGTRRLGSPAVTQPSDEEERRHYAQYFYIVRGTVSNSDGQSQHVQWRDKNRNAHAQWYLLQSSGPQLLKWYFGTEINTYLGQDNKFTQGIVLNIMYDASNGTISPGTIMRVGGQPTGRGSVLGRMILINNG